MKPWLRVDTKVLSFGEIAKAKSVTTENRSCVGRVQNTAACRKYFSKSGAFPVFYWEQRGQSKKKKLDWWEQKKQKIDRKIYKIKIISPKTGEKKLK